MKKNNSYYHHDEHHHGRGRGEGRGYGRGIHGHHDGHGEHRHTGSGRGRHHDHDDHEHAGRNKGGAFGPSGYCVCVKCGYRTEHQRGVKCTTLKCPECGHVMARQELLDEKKKNK